MVREGPGRGSRRSASDTASLDEQYTQTARRPLLVAVAFTRPMLATGGQGVGDQRRDRRGREQADAVRQMLERVANEITTTFASSYTREVSLTQALDPDVIRSYHRKATGEKFLIVPSRD